MSPLLLRIRLRRTLLQLLWNSTVIVTAFNGTREADTLNGGAGNPVESVLQQLPSATSVPISPQPFTVIDSSGTHTITLGSTAPTSINAESHQANTGVQVVPIVLGGSTFVNTIPISEFKPLPVPSMTALVVPYPPPGSPLSESQVPNSRPESSLPVAASSPGASSSPSSPQGSQAPATTPAATARPLSSASESPPVSTGRSQIASSSVPSSGASSPSASVTSSPSPPFSSSSSLSSPQLSSTALESTQATSSQAQSTTVSVLSTVTTNTATSSSESSSINSSSTSSPSSSSSSEPVSRTSGSLGPGSTIAPPNNGDSAADRSWGSVGGSLSAWLVAAACLGIRQLFPG